MKFKPTNFSRFLVLFLGFAAIPFSAQTGKTNILVIFGDDLGQSNVSAYSRGLMGFTAGTKDK